MACKLYRPGSVGFVSKSGGMSNEMYNVLSRVTDAATTALYIQSVVSGEKPAPSPLLHQVACLQRALNAMHEQAQTQEKLA